MASGNKALLQVYNKLSLAWPGSCVRWPGSGLCLQGKVLHSPRFKPWAMENLLLGTYQRQFDIRISSLLLCLKNEYIRFARL